MRKKDRYQLRFSAGKYWLLDMEQSPDKYCAPFAVNETGALIVKSYLENEDLKESAKALRDAYGIEWEEALQDAGDFLRQLQIVND